MIAFLLSIPFKKKQQKNNIVKIPKRTTKIPPKICHLKAMQIKISKTAHGNALGMFFKNPLFSAPDNKAKMNNPIAKISNKTFAK